MKSQIKFNTNSAFTYILLCPVFRILTKDTSTAYNNNFVIKFPIKTPQAHSSTGPKLKIFLVKFCNVLVLFAPSHANSVHFSTRVMTPLQKILILPTSPP